MKNTVLILSLLCFAIAPNSCFSQDVIQHPVNESIQKQAKKQTNDLMQTLGLTTKQALLVEDKLTEFLMYKKKIVDASMPENRKTKKLKDMIARKFSEMHDILTQAQYDLYVRMK